MGFFHGLSLKNYKLLKDRTEFNFAPITVLTGTNSSGKSSVIQALQIMQRFFKDVTWKTELDQLLFRHLSTDAIGSNRGNMMHLRSTDSDSENVIIGLPITLERIEDKCWIDWEFYPSQDVLKSGKCKSVKIRSQHDELVHIWIEGKEIKMRVAFNWFFDRFWAAQERQYEEYTLLSDIHMLRQEFPKLDDTVLAMVNPILDKLNTLRGSTQCYKVYSHEEGSWGLYNNEDTQGDFDEEFTKFSLHPFHVSLESLFEDQSLSHYNKADRDGICISILRGLPELFNFRKHLIHRIELDAHKCASEEVLKYYEDELLNCLFKEQQEVLDIMSDTTLTLPIYLSNTEDKPDSTYDHVTSFLENPLNPTRNHLYDSVTKSFVSKDTEWLAVWNSLFNFEKSNINSNLESQIPEFQEASTQTANGELFFKGFVANTLKKALRKLANGINSSISLESIRTNLSRIQQVTDNTALSVSVSKIFHENIFQRSDVAGFLSYWVKEFRIADKIELDKSADDASYRIYLIKGQKRTLLSDEGFGVSQLLPILLRIAAEISHGYDDREFDPYWQSIHVSILIEEPDANLHPALQSKLADLFHSVYSKYRIQFILETHSEYLIRKLQYLTAKGNVEVDEIQIYYFSHPEDNIVGEPRVKKINIQKDGSLTDDFGNGFFDEADKIAMSIWNMNNAQKN